MPNVLIVTGALALSMALCHLLMRRHHGSSSSRGRHAHQHEHHSGTRQDPPVATVTSARPIARR